MYCCGHHVVGWRIQPPSGTVTGKTSLAIPDGIRFVGGLFHNVARNVLHVPQVSPPVCLKATDVDECVSFVAPISMRCNYAQQPNRQCRRLSVWHPMVPELIRFPSLFACGGLCKAKAVFVSVRVFSLPQETRGQRDVPRLPIQFLSGPLSLLQCHPRHLQLQQQRWLVDGRCLHRLPPPLLPAGAM